jgi:AraC-like DNA-binding protein
LFIETRSVHPAPISSTWKLKVDGLLSNEDLKLADIALRSGFADQSHFNWVFKNTTGMTPKQYRELLISSQIQQRDLV